MNIATELLRIEAIKLQPDDPFTWASGRKAPIYCDNRLALSYPTLRSHIRNEFILKSKELTFGSVAGVATAGIAHGALIAQEMGLPFAYVRSKPKAHGRQNQLEGRLPKDQPVLVIEDLISTGMSSLQAVQVLREMGFTIAGVMAIFTYALPTAEAAFREANCQLVCLTDYPALIRSAKENGQLTEAQLTSLEEWRMDPVAWSEAQSSK